MGGLPLFGALPLAAMAFGVAASSPPIGDYGDDGPPTRHPRGKRAQAKPRKRPNMRHVSKRTRAKHRKAAKR
jgi:hypothetical protein